ncbi:MAG: asparagine synthase-related protein, partial [Pseudomonadota bacterium]
EISTLPFPWARIHPKVTSVQAEKVFVSGNVTYLDELIAVACSSAASGSWENFCGMLSRERMQFGLIVETQSHVIACVDRVTSYPLFVWHNSGDCAVRILADMREVMTPEHGAHFNANQGVVFRTCGYCVGTETLLQPLSRIMPGTFLVFDKRTGRYAMRRYFNFHPSTPTDRQIVDPGKGELEGWHDRLEQCLRDAIARLIEQANGGRIWLALSAGFDSRVLLGSLVAARYDNVATFSYGTPGNMEAKLAQAFAAKVGVPWYFIPPSPNAVEDSWRGSIADYMFAGGGVSATPAVTEIDAIMTLSRSDLARPDDLYTNGQTGDFISGAHLPPVTTCEPASIAQWVRDKHFALFSGSDGQLTVDRVTCLLEDSCRRNGSAREAEASLSTAECITASQTLEWRERQARYILNQQRAYDHLGLRWSLPLWDADIIDLFNEAPFALRYNQSLYSSFVRRWNVAGLFDEMRRPYDPWPMHKTGITLAARAVGVVGGARAKAAAYKRLYYFSDQNYLAKRLGLRVFQAFIHEARSFGSLIHLDYLLRVKRVLGVAPACDLERKYMRVQMQKLPAAAAVRGSSRAL